MIDLIILGYIIIKENDYEKNYHDCIINNNTDATYR